MCVIRRIIAYLCLNMINFDAVDFSERRSEEVISFFWRSVYNTQRNLCRNHCTPPCTDRQPIHAAHNQHSLVCRWFIRVAQNVVTWPGGEYPNFSALHHPLECKLHVGNTREGVCVLTLPKGQSTYQTPLVGKHSLCTKLCQQCT